LGGLGPRRTAVIADLKRLPPSPLVPDEEVLELILARQFSGRGIGWVDVHLLASALVAGCGLWTFDGRLGAVARDLGVVSVHRQPLQQRDAARRREEALKPGLGMVARAASRLCRKEGTQDVRSGLM
jgi:hypothetical protein